MKHALRSLFFALALVGPAAMSTASAQDFYITDCSLGCSTSTPGAPIFCGVLNVHENEVIEVGFSLPIDPASLTTSTFRVINVNNGTSPQGTLRVSPWDPARLLFEPATEISGFVVGFEFEANETYELFIAGVQQGDAGPFIESTSGMPNLGRMVCSVFSSEGVLPLARPECLTTPNSVGPGAVMGASGSTSLFLNDLELSVTGLPAGSFGVLIVGLDPAYRPLGSGFLCVDRAITRQGVALSSSAGEVAWAIDNASFGSGLMIALGETWRFQHIYRDVRQGQAVFTASDAIRATFRL